MIDLFPRMTEKVQQWAFNGKFGKNFENVFDLQMWCLGVISGGRREIYCLSTDL